MDITERADQKHQKDLHRLRSLRPIDDDFMRCLFKDNIPLAEFVLRIITDKPDLVITNCQTQKDMKRLAGARSICLDAYGTDSIGKKYDLEIQREDKGANPHRARFHSSVLDIENLNASELPETFTIFITEKDFYGMGEPIYPIERVNLVTGKPFEDGEHILYVNGEYRDETPIGKLMHDFSCTDPADMHYGLLADRVRFFKESKEGVAIMCKAMEDMRNQAALERVKTVVYRMLAAGKYSLEEIADITELSLGEIEKLQAELGS